MTQIFFFIIIGLQLLFPLSSFAATIEETGSTDVQATVPSFEFASADLIAPPNNSATNNPRPTFIWERPDPLPVSHLNHYDLYLDGTAFASNIPDNLTSLTLYFYTASASGNLFYVSPSTDLSQGYHLWHVVAYTDAGTTSTTGDWRFYLDSTNPTITVTKIDGKDYSSTTTTYNVSTANPLLSGTVETNANMTLSLDSGQTYTGNYPTGTWQHRFQNLLPGTTYTVYLAATDAAGNTYTHPAFYLIYGTPTATPTPTVRPTAIPTVTVPARPTGTPPVGGTPSPFATPSASPSASITPTLPPITATLTPPPELINIITPTQYIPQPPPSPTPPPPPVITTPPKYPIGKIVFYFFLLLGLPLHLLMAFVGTQTPFSHLIRFLFTLGYPFLTPKTLQTLPFTSISFYYANNLQKPWKNVVSDIRGWFNLPTSIPDTLFIILTSPLRYWKNSLFSNTTILNSCLYPNQKKVLSSHDKLSSTIYDLRSIPLIVAFLTSLIGLYFFPNVFVIIYFYFTVQYTFSEYVYPKIK